MNGNWIGQVLGPAARAECSEELKNSAGTSSIRDQNESGGRTREMSALHYTGGWGAAATRTTPRGRRPTRLRDETSAALEVLGRVHEGAHRRRLVHLDRHGQVLRYDVVALRVAAE